MEQVPTFNVTFEPGCRNNWHIHHATSGGGQLLICVSGRGWYQEWGKEARELRPGDVVNIPANVKHWHGAAADSWFQHIAQEIPGENASAEWCEAVSDEAAACSRTYSCCCVCKFTGLFPTTSGLPLTPRDARPSAVGSPPPGTLVRALWALHPPGHSSERCGLTCRSSVCSFYATDFLNTWP